jgi:phosphatidylserine/phosphatidylglycerophosphate/cardiolipin synthase-like enzyme
MSVIVDAEDYFRFARAAMLKARRRIMLIGWDFDARIQLVRVGHDQGEPRTVGEFIYWLATRTPELEVFFLRWDVGALKTLTRGTTFLTVLKWMSHPRIHIKLDSFHPIAGSHHQKIIVIDDCVAFCGGIDMTGDRWDTRAHRDDEPGRRRPGGKSYGPWHDATTAVQGPIAAALGELSRDRWKRAGGTPIEPATGQADCWPDELEADFQQADVSVARTLPEMPDCPEVREIEALFEAQIRLAKRSIYAESQYFASARIAAAIAARLDEPDGPEIVIINPLSALGWLETLAMDTARARLMAALRKRDAHGRLRMYHPFTAGGEPIYVHAKVLIIDDASLRIGSANMNNRSLGLDSECDVVVEAHGEAQATTIRSIRDGLIAEHLGIPRERVATNIDERGSIIEAIERLRGKDKTLRPFEITDLTEVEQWLADKEVLDPEGPSGMFEPTSGGGLLRRLRRTRPVKHSRMSLFLT